MRSGESPISLCVVTISKKIIISSVKPLCGRVVFGLVWFGFVFLSCPDINRTGTQMQNKIIFIL